MLNRAHLAVADHHVGFAAQDGRDQVGDAVLRVLVVGIGVDDDISPQAQAGIQAGLEGGGQPLITGVTHHMVYAQCFGDFDGAVTAAVVYDQDFDLIDAGDMARDSGNGNGQGGFFVMARYLDNQFHAALLTPA